ncbi:Testis-expressed protein 36 [Varanus komodoensis]|uniref:testis-expressed protein 36 n=1 Tax=Varanus komodoensis TaxID=61221 RepID=UPI001CF7D86F|nr:testis-expressed protein 36 [Varanus komodoensis]KAF7239218.1 Testis-expressed protein 36 [Varanus komodoensis]
MPKGRRANPSTARDGVWFKQCGNLQIYPESLTASMQKQILNVEAIHQVNNRLPLMYKVREKKPVNTFPFSVHDNRHCLLNVGEYLDSGLGLKKFQQDKYHNISQNYFFLAHEPIPSSTSHHSIYQTSFVQYPNTEKPFLGRFPKSHINRSFALNSAPKNECLWFSKCHLTLTDRSSVSEPEQLLLAAEQVTECKKDTKTHSCEEDTMAHSSPDLQ